MDKLVSFLVIKTIDFGLVLSYTLLTLTGIGLILGVI